MSDVVVTLVGDRFVALAPGRWLDLATGEPVAVVVRPISRLTPNRVQWCEEKLATTNHPTKRSMSGLIDCGVVGTTGWFEAHAAGTRSLRADDETTASVGRAVRRLVTAAETPSASGIRVLSLSQLPKRAHYLFAQAAVRELRPLGFVTIRASLLLPLAVARELVGRHLVVIGVAGEDRDHFVKWIRRLCAVSSRGHIVVEIGSDPDGWTLAGPVSSLQVRERATSDVPVAVVPLVPADEWTAPSDPVAGARLRRASACVKRGRHRAAERWLRAAFESAKRHANPEMEVRAGCQLVNHLAERGAWDEARTIALDYVDRVGDWTARVTIAVAAARTLIATGELRSADALLASILAEAQVRHERPPPPVRLRLAELRFWQGRFEEAATLLPALDVNVDALVCRGLLAWTMSDREALDEVVTRLSSEEVDADRRGHRWFACFSALRDCLRGQPAVAFDSARRLVARLPRVPHAMRGLTRAIAVEVLLTDGHMADARSVLGPRPTPSHTGSRLEAAVLDWLRTKARTAGIANAAAERFIEQSGAQGIRSWGSRSARMYLHHAMPALLHIIQDAEDELAALVGGCAWVRSQGRAEAVGIVTTGDGRLVAADGLRAAELATSEWRDLLDAERGRTIANGPTVTMTLPIRHAGTTLGLVAARGPAQAAATLAEAALALASLCGSALRARIDALSMAHASQSLAPEILGCSPAMGAIRESIMRAATTAFPVLIEGPSGTGKELVARALHRLSPRRDRRFSAINCAALTDDLVEAELFGYARGAFTGAVGARAGLFEEAHLGSLFLDEVSELSARAQAKLLRAVQEREIRRLGENSNRPVDVRIIAATNRPLGDAAGQGGFREDLMFRLAVVRIRLPALRERIEDVPLLAQAFWRHVTTDTGKRVALGADAIAALCRHEWPGNVRELQNTMAALAVVAPPRGRIGARHVGEVLADAAGNHETPATPLAPARRAFERRMVAAALARHGGRRAGAARELGLTRQGLTKAIRRLGLEVA